MHGSMPLMGSLIMQSRAIRMLIDNAWQRVAAGQEHRPPPCVMQSTRSDCRVVRACDSLSLPLYNVNLPVSMGLHPPGGEHRKWRVEAHHATLVPLAIADVTLPPSGIAFMGCLLGAGERGD